MKKVLLISPSFFLSVVLKMLILEVMHSEPSCRGAGMPCDFLSARRADCLVFTGQADL